MQGDDTVNISAIAQTDWVDGNKGADLIVWNFNEITGHTGTQDAVINVGMAANLTVNNLSTEDVLRFQYVGTGTATLDSLADFEAIANVTDSGGDVTIKLLADANTIGAYGTVTITLAGIGDGTIDDLQDLDDRGYNIDYA